MSTQLPFASRPGGPGPTRAGASLWRLFARVGLAIWIPAVALGVGSLMVSHWAPLPEPEVSAASRLSLALEDLLKTEQPSMPARNDEGGNDSATSFEWSLVHVLYESCGCSRAVAQYLVEGERPENVSEWLLLVSNAETEPDVALEEAATTRGFHIKRVSREALEARYGIAAAPLFIVLDPSGSIRFCGGYTDHKQGLHYLDRDVLRELHAGAIPAPIPVYGCGVSRSLQAALDPLALKY